MLLKREVEAAAQVAQQKQEHEKIVMAMRWRRGRLLSTAWAGIMVGVKIERMEREMRQGHKERVGAMREYLDKLEEKIDVQGKVEQATVEAKDYQNVLEGNTLEEDGSEISVGETRPVEQEIIEAEKLDVSNSIKNLEQHPVKKRSVEQVDEEKSPGMKSSVEQVDKEKYLVKKPALVKKKASAVRKPTRSKHDTQLLNSINKVSNHHRYGASSQGKRIQGC